MAAPAPETPFVLLLKADSEHPLPDDDAEVSTDLMSYGVIFKKGKKFAPERLELLAGLMWVHAHQADLHVVWPTASDAQHRSLATALRLDHDKDAVNPAFLAMVVRRVLATIPPGATPEKRKAPSDIAEGQIKKPGDDEAAAAATGQAPPKKGKPAKKPRKPASPSSSCGEDNSAASSDVEVTGSTGPLPCMPSLLGAGPEFAALVAAKCLLPWVATSALETQIPAAYRSHLFRGKMWDNIERRKYDKMISDQKSSSGKAQRRENPNKVACPHRLSFAYSNDEEMLIEAQHLAMVCSGETLSDFAGEEGRLFGGLRGRSDFVLVTKSLQEHWTDVSLAVERSENIGAPAISSLFDAVNTCLERRYDRFACFLAPGRLREEVLANVARQLGELRTYFSTFMRNLSDRCTRRPYAEQAHFAGSRYIALLGPAVRFLLDVDGAAPGLATVYPGGGGGGAGGRFGPSTPPAATPPPARRRLGGVSFADGTFGDPPSSPAPPPPAYSPLPPAPAGWQYAPMYSTGPATYVPPAGSPFPPPPPYQPFPSLANSGPWAGYPHAPPPPATPPAPTPPAQPQPRLRSAIKTEPESSPRPPFLSQPQHVWLTGPGYNAVPAGDTRSPPCGCASKHGPTYQPGPHATWDCPHRYISRYGSCPGFLMTGMRDPQQWSGDNLTRGAKDAWIKLIETLNLPLPSGPGGRAPDFSS